MSVMLMHHEEDPRAELLKAVGDLSNVQVYNNLILVATYKRPEKTKSGIILTDTTRKEDEYQGKVGLVIKKGPLAFVDDKDTGFEGQNVELGSWVVYRYSDGTPLSVHGVHCRLIEDTHVKLAVASPDEVL